MTDEELIEEIKGMQRIVINVVINVKYGGFSLSAKAEQMFRHSSGITDPDWPNWYYSDIARDDPSLVSIVRELGADANGEYASLKIVEVPYGVEWQIEERDGDEWVAEKHRTWR